MGINIRDSENAGLPKISFITRNQVIIWISDPTLKSKVRGLLILMTTYIPNVRTRQGLELQEELEVHFATNTAENDSPPPPAIGTETMAMSLSIAPIKTSKSQKTSLTELFTDVRRKFNANKESTLADLPLQEYISRGWDVTNKIWQSAIWTSLDNDFRNTDLDHETVSTGPVRKLG
ncbi:hypothetical protein B0H19DRAFT_97799 [Mycena capillaripes]|nr:hypothetical protein B0H19DRAFT_97799 [Mycena capillaripes]